MKSLISVLTLALLAAVPGVTAGEEDLAVIVNQGNSTVSLTKSQLRKLVLGDQGSWPGGATVALVLGPVGSPERAGVLRTVCRMTETDYNQHKMLANFSGETNGAARIASSPKAVLDIVRSTPGAIAFLRPVDVTPSVKVISIDGAFAGELGYKVKAGK